MYVLRIDDAPGTSDRPAHTILQRVAAQDQAAVDDCLTEYGGLVWRLARRYLDRADSETEDAVQEVFVEVWLSAKRFDPASGSEAAFVATIAHRRLIDFQRRVTSRRRTIRKMTVEDPPTLSAGNNSGEEAAELMNEFDQLPLAERQALWLFVRSGMTHKEIAEATGSPIGTVKTRLRRGLARLRNTVSPVSSKPTLAEGGPR